MECGMGVRVKKCRKSWYVFIYHHGQRKAKHVGSREAAEKVRREIEARLAMGDLGVLSPEASGIPTLADYVATWQKHYAAREMKPSTAHFYDQFLRLYVLLRIPMMVMGDSDGIVMDVSEAS